MLSKKCSYDDRPMIPEYIKLASVSLSVFFFQHELHRNAGQHNPKVIGFSVWYSATLISWTSHAEDPGFT
jgi:hypothetical protein